MKIGNFSSKAFIRWYLTWRNRRELRRHQREQRCEQRNAAIGAFKHRRETIKALGLGAFIATAAASPALAADLVFTGYSFPGAGSPTSRTMPQRIGDIFNVKEYDALGNGVHDDTANIQAAITAASNKGIIFFPTGFYIVSAPILVPRASSLILTGCGDGSVIAGGFNGFIFDNLSTPYSAASGITVIERLNIQNGYTGNNFSTTANGTWSASGSPVSITLSGSNPGIAAGGALFINDSRFSTNSVFVGMITNVASWPTVTVSSTAIASGATSNLAMKVVQCYAASGSWSGGAATITMATTPPAGISGQYYVYDYEYILADRLTTFNFGVATWSGTTLTFTPGTSAIGSSVGASDRLWLAPVAGCVRYSSVVGATVRDCTISGFIGVTSSEDKIVANDPTVGAAEGFEITVERCNFSNPSALSAVPGQTGIYLQNNSLAYYNSFNTMWCGVRLSGTACSIIGGRAEVCYFGYLVAGDNTSSNNASGETIIASLSMESNLLGIFVGVGGNVNINAVGAICNAVNPIGGMRFHVLSSAVVQNSGAVGNFGTGYAIWVDDAVGAERQNTVFMGCSAANLSTPSQSWRLPAQSWWGTCIQCDNPALVYTFANLPDGTGSPTPIEGETYDISDCNTATFLATAAGGGTGATAHRRVRYNAATPAWQVIG